MGWIDTVALKRDHPVKEIVERYGVELRPSGYSLVGRCPFHDDGGRPNLYVYPCTQSWYCYRCGVGGDAISFVQRIEGIGFRYAVERLAGGERSRRTPANRTFHRRRTCPSRQTVWGPDERACLVAAVELYHNRLLTDATALAYIEGRGLDRRIIERCRLGYVAGDELVSHLRWRRIPVQAALRVGLLRRGGREFMAGRIVVPEIRDGQPIWLVGRTLDPKDNGPKYLGLSGRKPLLGWEAAMDSQEVFLVEGVFDWLTLLSWGYPVVAIVGTHVRPEALEALDRFERIFLLLDNDVAGQEAAENLAWRLGSRAVIVRVAGVKDVAELAAIPDGREIVTRNIQQLQFRNAA